MWSCKLARKIVTSQNHRTAVGKCVGQVRAAAFKAAALLGHASNICIVDACGSHAQGTDIEASDTEVALRLANTLSQEQREAFFRKLREQFSTPTFAPQWQASDSMRHFRYAHSPLSIQLKGTSTRMVAHVLVCEQVRINDKPPTIDDVVNKLCDTCKPSRDVIRLVKLWATNSGFTNHEDGHLSSLGWTLLVIFFLQSEKLIPSYQQLAGNRNTPQAPALRVSELLRGFFVFLSRRPNPATTAHQGVSVALGEEISADFLAASGRPDCLCIEDPAEFHNTKNQSNIAQHVGQAQWGQAIAEAKKAADRLCARPQRWFHWGEIFDPRQLPLDKIQKIEPLKEVAAKTLGSARQQGGQEPEGDAQTNGSHASGPPGLQSAGGTSAVRPPSAGKGMVGKGDFKGGKFFGMRS